MPSCDFVCNECNHKYEDLCDYDPTGVYPETHCPKCSSESKTPCLSIPAIKFAQPIGTSKMEDFSYRAGFYMERAKEERRQAEKKSKASDFYNTIDDISSGDHFDPANL